MQLGDSQICPIDVSKQIQEHQERDETARNTASRSSRQIRIDIYLSWFFKLRCGEDCMGPFYMLVSRNAARWHSLPDYNTV